MEKKLLHVTLWLLSLPFIPKFPRQSYLYWWDSFSIAMIDTWKHVNKDGIIEKVKVDSWEYFDDSRND